MDNAIDATLDVGRSQVETQRRWLARLAPDRQVQNARQRVDDLTGRMALHWRHLVQRRRDQLDAQRRALQAANPDAILQRGYAIVTRGDGQRVTSVAHAAEGSRVQITLRDGQLIADVRERKAESEQ
ncbi:MAG: hypothetical protein EHM39_03040 [Chloroflexi bacterium]|nr:MAG: hypothetical protein EHM39_03040 [Chloroflexota bacterium]